MTGLSLGTLICCMTVFVPWDAVIKSPPTEWLKTKEIYCVLMLEARVQDQINRSEALALRQSLKGRTSLHLYWFQVASGCITPVSAPSPRCLLLCVSLMRSLAVGFKAQPDIILRSCLNYTCKDPFPNKIKFSG